MLYRNKLGKMHAFKSFYNAEFHYLTQVMHNIYNYRRISVRMPAGAMTYVTAVSCYCSRTLSLSNCSNSTVQFFVKGESVDLN
jgi:hypothetical protein